MLYCWFTQSFALLSKKRFSPLFKRHALNNMSIRHREPSTAGIGQSPGCDPKTSKRSSGLFSFFKWFKTSTSRESVTLEISSSSSCDSLNSISSNGTVASFSFISPVDYTAELTEKNIVPGPETDTYKARLKQRDKRRENDKNVTLRKKYNLFFHRDTLLKPAPSPIEEADNSKSLPLMTKKTMKAEEEKLHRRTNSESSKLKKAGAYCHVKGKRKAPQPPLSKSAQDVTSTMSLRRKKRLAPQPPSVITPGKLLNSLEKFDNETIEYADADIIYNDCLKLDHGMLKSVKEAEKLANKSTASSLDAPVSPRPWYKRNSSGNSGKKDKEIDDKYEPIELFVDPKQFKIKEEKCKKKDDKRKSGISFLTNISELDREASEIIKKENRQENGDFVPPLFMRPKHEVKTNSDSWISPKRKSAKDLIAKFNAITSVTKVTVNSAIFGSKESGSFKKENFKRDYFGKSASISEEPSQFNENESNYKLNQAEIFDNRIRIPLMKSESAIIKSNNLESKEVVKLEKKSWFCPKCSLENDYWRIICYVCATIKPYFDDLTALPTKNSTLENNKTQKLEINHFPLTTNSDLTKNTTQSKFISNPPPFERQLERSKTQIGFSALEKYNQTQTSSKKFTKSASVDEKPSLASDKQEERERLKKMLIEMKNSLPKRKYNLEKSANRTSVIHENAENTDSNQQTKDPPPQKNDAEKVNEILITTTETIYENIKVKRTENPKPIKLSSSAQTSSIAQKLIAPPNILEVLQKPKEKSNFELLRPKDFANIYNVKTVEPDQHVYTNLMEDKHIFLNVSKKFNEIKNSFAKNTDTLEVNRLLKRLESAIAKGELSEASNLARDLAQLKINCSVVRQNSKDGLPNTFMVNMYVEDKVSHRGPFPVHISENYSVAQLKMQVEKEFQIPVGVQRWILGKRLVSDDNALLKDVDVTQEGCSIFLYLVASASSNLNGPKPEIKNDVDVDIKPGCSNDKNYLNNKPIEKAIASSSKEESLPVETANLNPEPNKPKLPSITNQNLEMVHDDYEDYDSNTLKPENKNWECIMCTFLNLQNNNVCAICATIRNIKSSNSNAKKVPIDQKQEELASLPSATKEEHYKELLNLDNADLVENADPFECLICLSDIEPHEGVTLRECLHQFCKPCLTHTIEYTEEAEIKCPYRDNDYSCDVFLQDREIKALLTPAKYEQFLTKSVTQAENKIDKSFHCKTPDCRGWCIFEDNVNEFYCPVCRSTNCLTCQAIHMGLNCKQYQESLLDTSTDEDTKKTKEMLEEMVNKREAIKCPTCHVILMKKWGCDWLRCSMCKTEICWVTRGPRWGPSGKGDTSGGCQCGVNGIKCHPQCNYCH